jgi:hypothetical protein
MYQHFPSSRWFVMYRIDGKELTDFEVAADGATFCLNFTDAEGRPGSLTLPSDCLSGMIVTMPRMMTAALRAKYRDESLRMVYSMAAWSIEAAAGDQRLILMLRTPDGFEVSFAIGYGDLVQMMRVANDESRARVHRNRAVN